MILESVLVLGMKEIPTLEERDILRLSKQIVVEFELPDNHRFHLDESKETEELFRRLIEEVQKSIDE